MPDSPFALDLLEGVREVDRGSRNRLELVAGKKSDSQTVYLASSRLDLGHVQLSHMSFMRRM